MGDKLPIPFTEIESFMKTTRTYLTQWEVLAIRQLSFDYIYQSQKKEVSEMPPYMESDEFTYMMSLKK